MIEHRPILTFVSHLILVIGVAIVALPVYVTFVASSLAVDEVLQSPMPMLPGSHLIQNYTKVLSQGASTNVTTAPVELFTAAKLFTVVPCTFVNFPPRKTVLQSAEKDTELTTPLTFGSQALMVPVVALKLIALLRVTVTE